MQHRRSGAMFSWLFLCFSAFSVRNAAKRNLRKPLGGCRFYPDFPENFNPLIKKQKE